MSPLAAFFRAHPDRKRITLARDVGISPGFVTQLCNDGKPGRAVAVKIAEWTAGKVKPEDWDALPEAEHGLDTSTSHPHTQGAPL